MVPLALACPSRAAPIRDAQIQASGATAGTYGSTTAVPSLTVNAQGIVTGASSVALAWQPSVAPSAVALGVNSTVSPNVVTATPSYGSAVEANGSRYEWQVKDPTTVASGGTGLPTAFLQTGTPPGTSLGSTSWALQSGSTAAYTDGTYNCYYNGSFWGIYPVGGSALIYGGNNGNSTTFPTSWSTASGAAPPPTFTPISFVGPDGTTGTYWTGPALVSGQNGVPALTAANSPLTFQVRSRGDSLSGTAAASPSAWVQSASTSYSGPPSPAENGAVVTAATYAVVANVDRFLIANASSNSVAFTLPDPTGYAGPEIDISRNDASTAYTVTVATAGTSKTVTNYTSVTAQYQVRHYVRLQDGSGWYGY